MKTASSVAAPAAKKIEHAGVEIERHQVPAEGNHGEGEDTGHASERDGREEHAGP
jgi:hypothetical protein